MGGLFLEEFFGMNSLFYFDVEGIDLFVKTLGKGRRKEGKFQSLDALVLIALKKH